MKPANALRWSFGILIFIGVVGWIVSGSAVYARLAYLGLILLVFGAAWAALSLRGIRVRREARNLRASMGDVFEEKYEVVNSTWPGCPWLEVVNRSPLPVIPGSISGSRLLTNIGARQKRFYTTRNLLTRRGAFPLGPTEIASGDPFGLFPISRLLPAREVLIVLPMTVPILTFPIPAGILAGGKNIRQKTMDVTPHVAGVREYVPGDPMKRIHWPTTAHRGRFMVKEFEQDPQADIWLFLDASRDSHFQLIDREAGSADDSWWLRKSKVTLPRDSFEYAVSISASLARFFLSDRRAVGLACAAGKVTVVPAERGDRQEGKILETLAFLQPQGTMPLYGLVRMQSKLLPTGSGVVLVTSLARPDLLLTVEDLQRRNLRPILVLVKAETFGGTPADENLVNTLINRNIPVCQIGFGDDMSSGLSLPAVYFTHPSSLPRGSYFART